MLRVWVSVLRMGDVSESGFVSGSGVVVVVVGWGCFMLIGGDVSVDVDGDREKAGEIESNRAQRRACIHALSWSLVVLVGLRRMVACQRLFWLLLLRLKKRR